MFRKKQESELISKYTTAKMASSVANSITKEITLIKCAYNGPINY